MAWWSALLLVALAVPAAPRHAPRPAPRDVTATPLTPQQTFDAGQRHFARGEYRQAAESFTLAAARLDPASKPRARYWAGLSWLGAGESIQARASFEDAAGASGPEAALARLGIALSWEAERRPERAEDALAALVQTDMGEAGPPALAHLASLAHARGDLDRERRARDRLAREYPTSMEAAEASVAPAHEPPAAAGLWVQIGAFSDLSNAEGLAANARHAGFASVVIRHADDTGLHLVMIGPLRSEDEARRALAQAGERLSVKARIVRTP